MRQEETLKAVSEILEEIDKCSAFIQDEVLVFKIRKIFDWFSEFSGEITTEDILNTVFSRFCIGK